MFCKWCGNAIRPTDTMCPSCKRQTPAMSNCGGLYDLRHTPVAAPPAGPGNDRGAAQELGKLNTKVTRGLNSTRKLCLVSLILSGCSLALCLILCISMLIMSGNLRKVRKLHDEDSPHMQQNTAVSQEDDQQVPPLTEDKDPFAALNPASEETESPTVPDSHESTDSCDTSADILNYSITATVNDDGTIADIKYDFGETEDPSPATENIHASKFRAKYEFEDKTALEYGFSMIPGEQVKPFATTTHPVFQDISPDIEWLCGEEALNSDEEGVLDLAALKLSEEKKLQCIIRFKADNGSTMVITIKNISLHSSQTDAVSKVDTNSDE